MAGELQRVPETSKDLEVLKHAITINQIIGRFLEASISIDHGTLAGLSDDDHPHYYNTTRLTAVLADYVTDTELTTALSSYVTSASLTTTLASYYTIAAADLTFAPISHTHDFADLQDIHTNRVLGRNTAGTGEIEELTVGQGLTLTGGGIQVDNIPTSAINNLDEAIDDRVGALLVAGTNITLTYNDGANTLTIDAAGGSGAVATDSIWDAAGDLAVGSGANTAVRLAKGSDGDVLTVVSGSVAWAAPSGGGGSSDPLELTDSATPTDPSAGTVKIYSHDHGAFGVPSVLFPTMTPWPLVLDTSLRRWNLNNDGSTQYTVNHCALTPTGSGVGSSGTMTGANLLQFAPSYKYNTYATVNTQCGARWTTNAAAGYYRNYTTHSEVGGFLLRLRVAYTNTIDTAKHFYGVSSGASNIAMGSGQEPSATLDCIGVGADSSDTNLHFMYNDGSGTCTKVDLGITKASLSDKVFDVYIKQDRNGDAAIALVNRETGTAYSTAITTDLIADNTLVYTKMYTGNGATGGYTYIWMFAIDAYVPIGAY